MAKDKYQFEVLFTPQEEGGYTAEIPTLPGCISEGETLEEAEKNIEEAVDLYMDTLIERGIPLPNIESKKVFKTSIIIFKESRKSNHA